MPSVISVRSSPKSRARWRNDLNTGVSQPRRAPAKRPPATKAPRDCPDIPAGEVKAWPDSRRKKRWFIGIGRVSGPVYLSVTPWEAHLILGAIRDTIFLGEDPGASACAPPQRQDRVRG